MNSFRRTANLTLEGMIPIMEPIMYFTAIVGPRKLVAQYYKFDHDGETGFYVVNRITT